MGSQYPLASVCVFVQTVALDIRLSLVCHLGQLRQNIFQLKFPLCSLSCFCLECYGRLITPVHWAAVLYEQLLLILKEGWLGL